MLAALSLLVASALSLLSVASGAPVDLPSSVVLVLPQAPLYVNSSSAIVYGVDDTHTLPSDDLFRAVNFTIRHPDGSITANGAVMRLGCTFPTGALSTFSIANNVTGDYELIANVTYGIPGGAGCTNLTYQTEIVTVPFTVLPLLNNSSAVLSQYTTTATFSSQPTGTYDVSKNGAVAARLPGLGGVAVSIIVGVGAWIVL